MKTGITEGNLYNSNFGTEYKVIEYIDTNNIIIEDVKNNYTLKVRSGNLVRGSVRSPYDRTILGVGFLGVGRYIPKDNTRIYQSWKNMLYRVLDKSLHDKYSTYKECEVSNEWECYQNYAEWHKDNYIEGYCLDKDILIKGNKLYSKDTCCFVPNELNTLFTKNDARRGNLSIGVTQTCNGKYSSNIFIDGKSNHIGTYLTENEAFLSYKVEKEINIKRLALKYKDNIESEVFEALLKYEVTQEIKLN